MDLRGWLASADSLTLTHFYKLAVSSIGLSTVKVTPQNMVRLKARVANGPYLYQSVIRSSSNIPLVDPGFSIFQMNDYICEFCITFAMCYHENYLFTFQFSEQV